MFAATLIILSNEFACLYKNKHYAESISNAINILKYCAASDAQAQRLLFIVTSFRSVVEEQALSIEMGQRTRSMHMDMSQGNTADPLADLAISHQSFVEQHGGKTVSLTPSGSSPTVTSLAGQNLSATAPSLMSGARATCPPEDTRDKLSPGSSRTATSQSRSVRVTTEGEKTESLGGEQELDFDCFWDFSPDMGSASHIQETTGNGRVSAAMQQPGVAEGHGYAHYAGFGTSAETQGAAASTGIVSAVPLFNAVNYQ